ncbi:AEX-3 domain-containing protein [Lineolata rhizophorae]|uniref:AEX-3 domain-containing protein n=1 Tax=Lineolata rhizophorae TaxID=578093 RepID=A0A6A6PBZ7_9PEZI|nr:AEX-3 domain-containing protein [Lineolata rhizophorae]
MAPMGPPPPPDPPSTAPLADYFFISGIESQQIFEERSNVTSTSHVDATIEEDRALETPATATSPTSPAADSPIARSPRPLSSGTLTGNGPSSSEATPRNSRFSYEVRKSTGSIISGPDQPVVSRSNRSSATIRGVNPSTEDSGGGGNGGGSGIVNGNGSAPNGARNRFSNMFGEFSDAEFTEALKKFAEGRETFVDVFSSSGGKEDGGNANGGPVSAGGSAQPQQQAQQQQPLQQQAQPQSQQHPQIAVRARSVATRPKTQRIVSEDVDQSPSLGPGSGAMRSGVGSIRRRISTMSSMKRQPSMMRQASVRTSRRLSGYNSVIPAPEPFKPAPNMHPLKRRYEPVLLDRYPPKNMVDEMKRRNPFPDYVPMFAFPDDVSVMSSDDRPRSTWHGFAMTNADNSKLYGICIIVWLPLNPTAAAELELQCEEWRKANMTGEERELASSLGERLAMERAKLSTLLAKLPSMSPESVEREQLEDDISAVEEKIALMTDMLRPVRHGAASKIEGLTNGETGLWIPRAYGILGRDGNMTSFWKEWLRAVVVPMTDGGILRVPPSSPKVGLWQPLERYVVNLCAEAFSPISSITQVELSVRELRLYARKEALNELPGSRNTDLYALFRALSVPNVVTLFEYVLSESRIILLSSHTAMLHLVCSALVHLIFPFKWSGVFIPILPARLVQAIEAPCPYIVGIDRRYDAVSLPTDEEFVLVDLDQDSIESTNRPPALPRQVRRKLLALLHTAAPLHTRCAVPRAPPPYAIDAFPGDAFVAENPTIFTSRAPPSNLANLVNTNSATFADVPPPGPQTVILNAFLHARSNNSSDGLARPTSERPSTSGTGKMSLPPSPKLSPVSTVFGHAPGTPVSRSDSGYTLQANLKEKRSGHFDAIPRRSSSFGFDRVTGLRRPSAATIGGAAGTASTPSFQGHHTTPSISTSFSTQTLNSDARNPYGQSTYAPSVYAPSTLAASTIMPSASMPASAAFPLPHATKTPDGSPVLWAEGHCLIWRPIPEADIARTTCSVCEERADDNAGAPTGSSCSMSSVSSSINSDGVHSTPSVIGIYRCTGCGCVAAHARCAAGVCVPCSAAFRPDMIRAAFVRCFASLLYTYRKSMGPPSAEQRRNGLRHSFDVDGFLRSLPGDNADYVGGVLAQTQAFGVFVSERELAKKEDEAQIRLFDQVVMGKRNRGRRVLWGRQHTDFISDTSDHLWRSAAPAPPNARFPGDYRQVISRIPAKLDPALMKEPRAIQGVPRIPQTKAKRKPIPSMLGPNANGRAVSSGGRPES